MPQAVHRLTRSDAAIGIASLLQIAAMVAVALRPAMFGNIALIFLLLSAIVLVALLIRTDFTGSIKVVLVVLIGMSLLTIGCGRDLFGIEPVNGRLVSAQRRAEAEKSSLPSARAVPEKAEQAVDIANGPSDRSAPFSQTLMNRISRRTPGSTVRVRAKLSVGELGSIPTYRLDWSLVRGEESLWCGEITEIGGSMDDAIANFVDRIAGAIDRSERAALTCSVGREAVWI